MLVLDVMSADLESASLTDNALIIAKSLATGAFETMPVCDGMGFLIGSIGIREVVSNCLGNNRDLETTTVATIYSACAPEIAADAPLGMAERLMHEAQTQRLFAVEEGRPVGVLTLKHLSRYIPRSSTGAILCSSCLPRGHQPQHHPEKESPTMTIVSELMHSPAECIKESETLRDAARKMYNLRVGSLPICGDDQRLHGMLSDRDIVIKCLAADGDPDLTTAADLAEGTPITVDAAASIEDALTLMQQNQVRRLPVISNQELVGILTQADIARHYPNERVGDLVGTISND